MFRSWWVRKLVVSVLTFGVLGCSSEQAQVEKKVEALLKAQDYQTALKLANEAVEKNPEKTYTRALKTRVLAESGSTRQAIAEYRRFFAQSEKHAPAVLGAIVRGALKAPNDMVRQGAARALGRPFVGDKEALPDPEAALKASDGVTRVYIAWTLGELGDKGAVPELQAALKAPDARVRMSAALAIGSVGDKGAVPALRAALTDSNRDVRATAAYALAKLGDEAGRSWAMDRAGGDTRALAVLARLGDKDALLELRASVRSGAATFLADLGDKEAVPALRAALTDSESRVRGNTALALGRLGDKEAVPELRAALKDSAGEVRWLAGLGLGLLGDKAAVPDLQAALGDHEELVQLGATVALWILTR